MKEKEIKSHIQMPKSMLKRFEGQHHQFYYYDVKKGIIGTRGHASDTNTQQGFYSKDEESFLNRNIETPFNNLFKAIDEISINPPHGHINSEFDYTAKRFVYALIARNPDNIIRVNDYLGISKQFCEQQTHDLGMEIGLAAENKRDFLAKYGTTVVVNTTDSPFILPTCGAYYLEILGFEHVVLPVSPQKAIAFIEEEGKSTIIHDGMVDLYEINNIQEVEEFNKSAFFAQCNYGNGFVVSSDKAALEKAKELHKQW